MTDSYLAHGKFDCMISLPDGRRPQGLAHLIRSRTPSEFIYGRIEMTIDFPCPNILKPGIASVDFQNGVTAELWCVSESTAMVRGSANFFFDFFVFSGTELTQLEFSELPLDGDLTFQKCDCEVSVIGRGSVQGAATLSQYKRDNMEFWFTHLSLPGECKFSESDGPLKIHFGNGGTGDFITLRGPIIDKQGNRHFDCFAASPGVVFH